MQVRESDHSNVGTRIGRNYPKMHSEDKHKFILILIFVPYLFLNQNAISHKQLIYKQLNYQD